MKKKGENRRKREGKDQSKEEEREEGGRDKGRPGQGQEAGGVRNTQSLRLTHSRHPLQKESKTERKKRIVRKVQRTTS